MARRNIGGAWDFFHAVELLQADGTYFAQSASSIICTTALKSIFSGVDR
jgi:hypothetical protein